jgi:acetylornithine deacetylase/succinyl-diaminopimelate desuccinylase-like protein
VANVVPQQAVAEIDIRTTREANAEYLLPLLRAFVVAKGWHLVDGEPTDEERSRYPRLARLTAGHPEKAARQEMDSPIGRWATAALEDAFREEGADSKPVRIRMMGGTLPTDALVGPLGTPFVLVPLVNADNNQHAYDENLRLGNYLDGIRTVVGLILTPYPD